MLESDVLSFGDFVTKSGRRTPFFINTGKFRTGSALSKLGVFYATAIRETFGTSFEVLFGPAYKGIPLSVATSIALSEHFESDVRFCSNRKEVKDHGDVGALLGGPILDGDRVLLIEDVTTAGTSIRESVPFLRAQADCTVCGLIVSVDRMEKGTGKTGALQEIEENFGFPTHAIVTMQDVVAHLSEARPEILTEEILGRIRAYYETYGIPGNTIA